MSPSKPKKSATPAVTLHEVLNTTYQTRWVGTATELKVYDMAMAIVEQMDGMEDLSTLGWGKLRGKLLQKGDSPGTINRKRSIWRVLCATTVELGIIPAIPRTKPERTQERAARFLSQEEEVRLLSALHSSEREVCVILLYTGLRKGELWSLEWEDIGWETRLIQVHNTKSGKRRFIPIPERVMQIFKDRNQAELSKPIGKLNHWTFDDHFRKACRVARVSGVTIHTLRHTYASRLAQNGIPLLSIQKLLGHSSPSTTLIYAHLSVGDLEDHVLRTFDDPSD